MKEARGVAVSFHMITGPDGGKFAADLMTSVPPRGSGGLRVDNDIAG